MAWRHLYQLISSRCTLKGGELALREGPAAQAWAPSAPTWKSCAVAEVCDPSTRCLCGCVAKMGSCRLSERPIFFIFFYYPFFVIFLLVEVTRAGEPGQEGRRSNWERHLWCWPLTFTCNCGKCIYMHPNRHACTCTHIVCTTPHVQFSILQTHTLNMFEMLILKGPFLGCGYHHKNM